MHFVTPSLSPVKTFTDTPFSLRALIADNVDFFGGSKKARYPIKTILASSATEKTPSTEGLVLCETAITRIP